MNGNTIKELTLRFFIYYDKKEKEFVGVCVDLGIIKSGIDPNEVKTDLENAAVGYIEAILKEKLPDDLLNQEPPKYYMDIFNKIVSALKQREVIRETHSFSNSQAFSRSVSELCPIT